jgi:signal transduction histidine kinase
MDERFRSTAHDENARDRGGSQGTALGVAHDFRNQLQLAASTARLVRREMLGRSDLKLAAILGVGLRALERAGVRAQRLGAASADDGDLEEVRLHQLIPDMRSLLGHALGTGVALESLVAEDLPALRCDPVQLENALLNLVLNARQAMPRGGRVVIKARTCTCAGHDDCVALSVADNGHGMSEEVAAKAFEPWFSTRLLDGGSGFGLYNVRSFAEAMGGSAELESRQGVGTQILLHLPAKAGGAAPRRFRAHSG